MLEGKVIALYISKKNQREKKESLSVDLNGVIGDKFYNTDKNRLILITSINSYNLAKKEGISINYGDLGENIITDLNLQDIKNSSKIYISDIEFKVTQDGTLCKGLSKIDSKLPKLLKNDRGVFISALSKGSINLNDKIILKKEN